MSLATFARTRGARDKKKRKSRIRSIASTAMDAAIGGVLIGGGAYLPRNLNKEELEYTEKEYKDSLDRVKAAAKKNIPYRRDIKRYGLEEAAWRRLERFYPLNDTLSQGRLFGSPVDRNNPAWQEHHQRLVNEGRYRGANARSEDPKYYQQQKRLRKELQGKIKSLRRSRVHSILLGAAAGGVVYGGYRATKALISRRRNKK